MELESKLGSSKQSGLGILSNVGAKRFEIIKGRVGVRMNEQASESEPKQAPGELVSNESEKTSSTPSKLWRAYCVPMILFTLFTALEGEIPKYIPALKGHYPEIYCVKALVVTIALFWYREVLQEVQYYKKFLLPALAMGLVACAGWVLIDRYVPYPHSGSRTAYNPFVEISNPAGVYAFLAVRFYGLVIMVPIMEEMFWRAFLLRYITDMDDFKSVLYNHYSINAFLAVTGLFALAHPEWLVALLFSAAANLLLKKTKSVFACIVFHAVTNLSLGIYVLISHDWKYW